MANRKWTIAAVFCGVLAVATSGTSVAETSFFKGKNIVLITTGGPGGKGDYATRVLARHLPKYIPGNPNIIVQNMPGGGGVIATNYLYNRAKRNGLFMAVLSSSTPMQPIMNPETTQYDINKMNLIGSVSNSIQILVVRRDRPWKTLDDMKKSKTPVSLGAQQRGATTYYMPRLMADVLGLNIKMIVGYRGGAGVDQAVVQGEVDGRSTDIELLLSRQKDWLTENLVIPLVQVRKERHPAFPNVPTLYELAPQATDLIDLVSMPTFWFGIAALPPDVPSERIKVLREAFRKLYDDKDFVRELEKQMPAEPTFSDKLEAEIKKLDSLSPKQLSILKGIYGF